MPYITDKVVSNLTPNKEVDFLNGAVLLIDKPLGWTSFDVVNKIRFKIKHLLGIKKIKGGHAGTLDPNATGLLIICTGKLTKEIDSLQAMEKIYSGSIFLGATTPTYDGESEPDSVFPISHIDDKNVISVSEKFESTYEQIPPIFSAIKINGQKSYDLARRGKEVEMKSRPVTIHSFDITNIDLPEVNFTVRCSKGTYIRSLAYDFGKALDSGGYLSSLRREAIGNFTVSGAFTMDEILKYIEQLDISKTQSDK